jgi:hypothetical protein
MSTDPFEAALIQAAGVAGPRPPLQPTPASAATGNPFLDAAGITADAVAPPVPVAPPAAPSRSSGFADVPFAAVRDRIIANEAPQSVGGYDAQAYNLPGGKNAAGLAPVPLSQMTLGQVYDYQTGPMRAATRGHRGPNDVGSTGAGAYQLESGTLAQNAEATFGPNWRDVPFTPQNQDHLAETLYNNVRGNPTQLGNTWAAFNSSGQAQGGSGVPAPGQPQQGAQGNPFLDAMNEDPSDPSLAALKGAAAGAPSSPQGAPSPAETAPGNSAMAPGQHQPSLLARAGQWLTEADPIANAITNGGDHKLATYGHGVQDQATALLLAGPAKIPEFALRGGAWALDHIANPVTAAVGGSTKSLSKASAWSRGLADWIETNAAGLAHDPNSPIFKSRELAGTVAATGPVSEVPLLQAIPALRSTVVARDIAAAAGDALPWSQRLAAGLIHYGDMAAGGAAAGAVGSGGKDVLANAAAGAVLAPAAGAAFEHIAAPIATRAGAEVQKLAQALRGRIGSAGSEAGNVGAAAGAAAAPSAEDLAAALAPLTQGSRIRTGAELPQTRVIDGVERPIANIGGGGDTPGVTMVTTPEGKVIPRVDIGGEAAAPPHGGASNSTAPPPSGVAPDSPMPAADDIRAAMGSQGARNGVEATTALPAAVAQHVAQLTREGVPLDQALREADIAYVGAKPTIAAVTRDPAHQQALNEGAKMVQTPEGQALNAQMAANNAAVTAKMKGLVDRYGGAPAPGEAAEGAARSLADAADAEMAKVTALYDAADKEAAQLKAQADERNATAQAGHHTLREEIEANYNAAVTAAQQAQAAKEARLYAGGGGKPINTIEPPSPPQIPPPPVGENAPGYIDLSSLRSALNAPELANPTIEGGKALRSGTLGLMDAYGGGSDRFNLRQAERLRQAINDAYDPLGGSINGKVGELKAVLDKALDDTQAGEAYRAARAAYKGYASRYVDPEGIAKLIRRDAQGNFLNADNWRKAENGLLGTVSDRDLSQIARQLQANGATAPLNAIKAGILQRGYNSALKGAADSGGNAQARGDRFFDALNAVGAPKLNILFPPEEMADIAATGRAAIHLNSQVPGTANHSNTASAALSNDMARRMMAGFAASKGKAGSAGVHAGASLLGAGVGVIGHSMAGPIAGATVSGVKLLADALQRRAAAKAVARGLADAGDPAAARVAAKARSARLAKGLEQYAVVRKRCSQATSVQGMRSLTALA